MRREILLFAVCAACGSTDPAKRVAPAQPSRVADTGSHDRVVAFAGAPVTLEGTAGKGPLRVEPALPPGLALDPATGAITGAATAAAPGALYTIVDGDGRERMVHVEIVAAPSADDRFVAPTGDDAGDGSDARPFRTIARALESAHPGTRIFLHAGRYLEDVRIRGLAGAADQPIVLRSVPGERASIEGAQPVIDWERAKGSGAAPDEWVSKQSFERTKQESTSRGAFADRQPFTRLLTYSRGEDLRAANQRWERGNAALPGGVPDRGPTKPWTYFGPGLWHDPADGRLHLRLSPTTNEVAGLADYDGPTDPHEVALSIWARSSSPLRIENASYIDVRDLRIVGGGEESVVVGRSEHITLDHVDIDAATMGLTIGNSTAVKYLHGRLDGGIPPWSFRSDYKDNYQLTEPDGSTAPNNLVRSTSRALLFVAAGNRDIEIAYSELVNAHDVYMAGVDSSLHHCRISNIHDEGLFVGHVKDIDNLRIHDNVIERVLTAVTAKSHKESGTRYIYRNLFDLREATAGFRPGGDNPSSWRYGHMFKAGIAASFYFYQNTILLPRAKQGKAALLHFRAFERGQTTHARWFVNNLIVLGGGATSSLAFLPDERYLEQKDAAGRPYLYSDGNAWVRMGTGGKAPLFRCVGEGGANCRAKTWSTIDAVQRAGFEKHSVVADDPHFRRMRSLEATDAADDLRPDVGSPALGTAIELPDELPDPVRGRDAGAFPPGAPPLRVGIDGRLAY